LGDIVKSCTEEVGRFLEFVLLFYRPFFVVAFFTGLRAGEMSTLKWKNVDFDRRIIKVVGTRANGEEGRPKTNSSYRDIDMLPVDYDALKDKDYEHGSAVNTSFSIRTIGQSRPFGRTP
jgi:integrase